MQQQPFGPGGSTQQEMAEGSAASALYERDDNATSFPSLFHQWKQVITPYPFTSLMGFSAMLRSAVMEHPLMKIHMASCLKISANHSLSSFFFFFCYFPITEPLENLSEFSTPRAKVVLIILENMHYYFLSHFIIFFLPKNKTFKLTVSSKNFWCTLISTHSRKTNFNFYHISQLCNIIHGTFFFLLVTLIVNQLGNIVGITMCWRTGQQLVFVFAVSYFNLSSKGNALKLLEAEKNVDSIQIMFTFSCESSIDCRPRCQHFHVTVSWLIEVDLRKWITVAVFKTL